MPFIPWIFPVENEPSPWNLQSLHDKWYILASSYDTRRRQRGHFCCLASPGSANHSDVCEGSWAHGLHPIVSKVCCSILRSWSELLTLVSSSQTYDPNHQWGAAGENRGWLGSDPLLLVDKHLKSLPKAESPVATLSTWRGQHTVKNLFGKA